MSVKISRTFQLLPDILSTNIDEKMHDLFEMGILVDVAGIFKILVPVCDNMIRVNGTEKEITYDQNENGEHFIRSTNDSSMLLEKGLLTRVVVSGVQYNPDTNAFNCFGDLII